MPASRPWVHRTALGTPVVPEVKIRRYSESSSTSPARSTSARAAVAAGELGQQRLVARRVPMTRTLSSATPSDEPLEQGGPLGVGDDHGAVGGPHVGGERLAPPGRVDPDDRRARPARRR